MQKTRGSEWSKNIVAKLNRGHVRTYKKLQRKTEKSIKHLRHVLGTSGRAVTSINKDRQGLVGANWLKKAAKKQGRLGFVKKGGYIFHIRGDMEPALRYAISRQSFAMTVERAQQLTGRKDVKRVLDRIVEENPTAYAKFEFHDGPAVYYLIKQKKTQLRSFVGIHKGEQPQKAKLKPWAVGLDEVMAELGGVLSNLKEGSTDLQLEMSAGLATVVVQTLRMESLRGMNLLLRLDERIRKICMVEESGVLSPWQICRYFRQLKLKDLYKLFYTIVKELIDFHAVKLKLISADCTHIKAWHNQHRQTHLFPLPPENASKGFHVEWYVGYKVHLLVDSNSEMPIAWLVTDNRHEGRVLEDLIKQLNENLEPEEVVALFGDASYDAKDLHQIVDEQLQCDLITNCNPRNDSGLKRFTEWIDEHFDGHPEIRSVEEVLDALPQKQLEDFGFAGEEDDRGSQLRAHSRLVHYIKSKLHLDIRQSVERVFSRLKEFTRFVRPRMRYWDSVQKHTAFCIISMVLVALVATKKGRPENMRRMARIY